jgi:hypothetical protein
VNGQLANRTSQEYHQEHLKVLPLEINCLPGLLAVILTTKFKIGEEVKIKERLGYVGTYMFTMYFVTTACTVGESEKLST